jgi:3-hydroxyisobutyrate dehydrogenase-like beta-hydroxyacid dehydrogenase
MGAGIATSVVRSFPLAVYDLRPEPVERLVALGARRAQSLKALADECDVVILVVLNDAQVTDVVGQLLEHTGKIHTIIVTSTVLPSTALALGEKAHQAGLDLIEAPISGGSETATRGILTVLIGGDERPVWRCWPILAAFGRTLIHIGPLGAGSASKLVTNLLSLGSNMLVLEAMELAGLYGIPEDKVTEFVTSGTGDCKDIRRWGYFDRARRSHTLAGTPALYEVFSKDVKAAAQAAGQRGGVLPITACIGAMMSEKMQARDRFLEANGLTGDIPRCRECGQELSFPFRKTGVHPECASGAPGHTS